MLADPNPSVILLIAGVEDLACLVRAVRVHFASTTTNIPASATPILFASQSAARTRFRELAGAAAESIRFPVLAAAPDNPNYDGEMFEGYPGLLHGGIVAALLDGAMTHCLFAHGLEALTAELTIRYHAPVTACGPTFLRAFLTRSRGRLHLLHAKLRQEGALKATALAKFLEQPR